jgi:hypothetical protein
MIPGEPFIDQPRELRLPGYQHPSITGWRAFEYSMYLLLIGLLAGCGIYMSQWFMTDPQPPSCVGIPSAEYPVLYWRGFDGAWVYNGAIVGYSMTEDATCMSINPIDN